MSWKGMFGYLHGPKVYSVTLSCVPCGYSDLYNYVGKNPDELKSKRNAIHKCGRPLTVTNVVELTSSGILKVGRYGIG